MKNIAQVLPKITDTKKKTFRGTSAKFLENALPLVLKEIMVATIGWLVLRCML